MVEWGQWQLGYKEESLWASPWGVELKQKHRAGQRSVEDWSGLGCPTDGLE